jgi:hypothetical protein
MSDKLRPASEEALSYPQLFTLRIWLEDLGEGRFERRGKVEHLASGQVCYFRDWQKLIDFLQEFLTLPDTEGGNRPPKTATD